VAALLLPFGIDEVRQQMDGLQAVLDRAGAC